MKAPRLTGKQILSALRRAGFVVVNVEGSHHQLRRVENGQRVGGIVTGRCTVPRPCRSGRSMRS